MGPWPNFVITLAVPTDRNATGETTAAAVGMKRKCDPRLIVWSGLWRGGFKSQVQLVGTCLITTTACRLASRPGPRAFPAGGEFGTPMAGNCGSADALASFVTCKCSANADTVLG